MLGYIHIHFGKIVDVSDDLKINRCKVSIDGKTDEIKTEDLPWYFPWYGLSYLPLIDDIVPVIIFDENYSTAFYGNKLDLKDLNLDSDDYENYLEIFKRQIDDKTVSLTYKKSTGIEFINDKGKIQIEKDKLSLFGGNQQIIINDDSIKIGKNAKEKSLLGDKSVKQLTDMIEEQANIISEMLTLFNAISLACVTPFTLPIKAALTPLMQISQTKLKVGNEKIKTSVKNIQSSVTEIE
jgi:RNA binding exosome subunit